MTLSPQHILSKEQDRADQDKDVKFAKAIEEFCKSCPFCRSCSIAFKTEIVRSQCSFGRRHFE